MTEYLKIPKGSRKDVILLSGPTERETDFQGNKKTAYDFLVEFEGSPFTWSTTSQPRAEELSKFTLGSPVGIEFKELDGGKATWIFHHNVEESVESVKPLGESPEEVLDESKSGTDAPKEGTEPPYMEPLRKLYTELHSINVGMCYLMDYLQKKMQNGS